MTDSAFEVAPFSAEELKRVVTTMAANRGFVPTEWVDGICDHFPWAKFSFVASLHCRPNADRNWRELQRFTDTKTAPPTGCFCVLASRDADQAAHLGFNLAWWPTGQVRSHLRDDAIGTVENAPVLHFDRCTPAPIEIADAGG